MSTVAEFFEVGIELHSVLADHVQFLVQMAKLCDNPLEPVELRAILKPQLFTSLIVMSLSFTQS